MAVYNTTADTTYLTADNDTVTADTDLFALPVPVTRSTDWYMGKITPWQAKPVKARFLATVRGTVQPFADAQAVIASLPAAFDLDLAVGAQLDVVGQWIGRSRNVPVPLPNAFFSFDTTNLGFDQGLWQGPYDSAQGISVLPDDLYRKLLNAKVMLNQWDGLIDSGEAILRTYFTDPATFVFIDDRAQAVGPPVFFAFDDPARGFDQSLWQQHLFAFDDPLNGFDQSQWAPVPVFQDYTTPLAVEMAICIAGKLPSPVDLAVLGANLLPVKPMGATVEIAVTTVDGSPLFGFDVENEFVSGFDTGAWGNTPAFVANLIT